MSEKCGWASRWRSRILWHSCQGRLKYLLWLIVAHSPAKTLTIDVSHLRHRCLTLAHLRPYLLPPSFPIYAFPMVRPNARHHVCGAFISLALQWADADASVNSQWAGKLQVCVRLNVSVPLAERPTVHLHKAVFLSHHMGCIEDCSGAMWPFTLLFMFLFSKFPSRRVRVVYKRAFSEFIYVFLNYLAHPFRGLTAEVVNVI